ncbi:MAG: crossover junction endodeoxyribonuclease RuvC [Clostridiales bacterium]|nr:crossover junction endodeoxyribonuclease RuvC [Clostridiales bacterium]
MIILGVDPGYATIGYGLIDKTGSRLTLIDYGVVTTPPDENIAVRLAMIDRAMAAIIQKHKPEEVAVEELFFNTNITTALKVAQARGVILLCAVKECGRLYEYTPLMIKQALTGNGRADKRQIQYMVKMLLDMKAEPKPDDAADALAAAICHANTLRVQQRII